MIRPISAASDGLISNTRKSLSVASNGLLLSTVILAAPKFIFSTDHNLNKIKRIQEIIKRDEAEILEIISFIATRIL